ncbi:epidermal growth factor receptor kinase substrate 8-like protein 3 isoform X2 [Triplophysa rosa]|uniref:Epidermal growth factor receptor kinase substrate 8-like protein 3 n=1 Tax=Triplophysa rosa TaxID=992332 RepID=A0A9W7T5D3_TRIRA|nr:epidermal growth factor receptor kinase substrate 8-like protein 3 isoform X2 [Triplophysa rosa]KAI7790955.1 putative epidermal growth factor receptor kinase substrate 8-like protein 3 [Triplophysa rosa]
MNGDSSLYSWTGSYAESLRSAGMTADDSSSELSSLSRPSARSIYLQRKDYADSINRQMLECQYRVEHLFTCELDGQQISSVDDCVERLKFLEATGRVWGQDVLLETGDGALLLKDIETKEELESWSFSRVVELRAVLDAGGVFDSLLTLCVQDDISRVISVFLFQCESLRADYLKKDVERLLHHRQSKITSKSAPGNVRQRRTRNTSPEMMPQKPPEHWSAPDYDEDSPTPPLSRNTSTYIQIDPPLAPPPQRPYTERDRDVDILNHLINDIEAFVDRVTAVAPKTNKQKKKKRQKKVKGMPSDEEFTVCLQKIKMAFNLLAKLQDKIENPSAADLTHCLFTILHLIVCQCGEDLPQTVVAPLLEPQCVVLLSEHASPDEDKLWQSLGDPWNIPSTKWPEDDEFIPTFTPVFDDGWTPPEIRNPEVTNTHHNRDPQPHAVTRQMSNKSWQEQTQQRAEEEPAISYLRAKLDFTARNDRELTVSKGEELQLLDMSKQWWKVRNQSGRVGHVPNNMLQSLDEQKSEPASASASASAPVLNRRSRAEEVRAWLEHKAFSRITIRCLGGLSGSMLLGMTRDELKVVCPEEGGRVYYQLQNVKSALAMASAVTPMI